MVKKNNFKAFPANDHPRRTYLNSGRTLNDTSWIRIGVELVNSPNSYGRKQEYCCLRSYSFLSLRSVSLIETETQIT